MYADLHLHTTASDGTLTPCELIAYAKDNGLDTIAITDHDTVLGLSMITPDAEEGIRIIKGIEFSCIYDEGGAPFLLHILGYGIDTECEAIKNAVELGKKMRREKHSLRLEYLTRVHGITFTEEEKARMDSALSVGRLHIASGLIERGLASTIREAIDKYMSAPDFPDGRISYRDAIRGITESGGVAVYAHPLGGECEARLAQDEVRRRIGIMKNAGIAGIECYYSRYSDEEISSLLSIADRLGMSVSGGSDFHGKNKTVAIGCLSADGTKTGEESLTVLNLL